VDHVVRTDQTVHLVRLGLLETSDSVESRDRRVFRVLLASLEYRVHAVVTEASVLEVLPELRVLLDSLDRLAHLEMSDLKVSRELLELQEQQDSLVQLAIPVLLESKDQRAVKVYTVAIYYEVLYVA